MFVHAFWSGCKSKSKSKVKLGKVEVEVEVDLTRFSRLSTGVNKWTIKTKLLKRFSRGKKKNSHFSTLPIWTSSSRTDKQNIA
jgi:hypothetical protein